MNNIVQADKRFIAQLQKRDVKAFHVLYKHYAPVVRMICTRYVQGDAVNDIVQDGFMAVFKNISQYREEGSFDGWIKRIFINKALEYIRKNKKMQAHFTIEDVEQATADHPVEEQDASGADEQARQCIESAELGKDDVLLALQNLPEHHRLVCNLYLIDHCSHAEIAAMLGINPTTSKTRLLRGRNILQQELFKIAQRKLQQRS